MKEHFEYIDTLILKHFKTKPVEVSRMTKGICNEVYTVRLPDGEVVVRMNADDAYMRGSDVFIPLFQSKNILVPTIIAEDYTKSVVPMAYQVLSKIDGVDIDFVIKTLSDEELKNIAKEIAGIILKLIDIPTNGKYGFVYSHTNNLLNSWTQVVEANFKYELECCAKTGVVDEVLITTARQLIEKYRNYFDTAPSQFYYDDMCSKNVMIYNGKFAGLVDLDGVAYGDCLEGIGRIMASWYGTHYGDVYTQAVMDELDLTKEQRHMVLVYAWLNRFAWLTENGVQFNMNTSSVVNWEQAGKDKKVLADMWKHLFIN